MFKNKFLTVHNIHGFPKSLFSFNPKRILKSKNTATLRYLPLLADQAMISEPKVAG